MLQLITKDVVGVPHGEGCEANRAGFHGLSVLYRGWLCRGRFVSVTPMRQGPLGAVRRGRCEPFKHRKKEEERV